MADLKWWYSGTNGPANWHKFCSIGEEQSPIDISAPLTAKLPDITFSYYEEPLRLDNAKYTVKAGGFEECSLTLDNVKYRLEEIHFHSPSEHQIESRAFPLETHLVHTGEGGENMVLSVFIEEGESKKDFNPLIESLERFGLSKDFDETLLIDPFDFIPKDKAYYTYQGSHTSPPCTEGVRWLIMRDTFTLPSAQIERLRRVVGENCRPIQ
ncbi:MAG: carbonic anhydrase family protein, partial [Proteobacteria bacterium]|nr:carbonic anhydrase family protein [Pseudomonadota bacterium]